MDQVILVTSSDQKIGVLDKIEAHRGKGRLHRAISVFLFNSQKELLIQQRSSKKIVGALQWANTCCGNVRPSESYEDCARRRLSEELGITDVHLSPVTKFEYQVRCNDEFSEHEMDTVFVGTYDREVLPNPDEVASYQWIRWKDFVDSLDGSFAPWVHVMQAREILSQIVSE